MLKHIVLVLMLLCAWNVQAAILVHGPDGRTVTKTTLKQANTAADAVKGRIEITHIVPLTENTTLATDRTYVIRPGGGIDRAGYVLTIPGDFDAGRHQVFYGSGSTKFTSATNWNDVNQQSARRTVFPEWFPGGVQEAAYSIAAQTASTTSPTYLGGVVLLAPKYYALTTTLVVPDHVWIDTEGGGGNRQGALQATGTWTATNPVVQLGRVLGGQYWSHDSRIRNCTIDGNFKANVGIYSASVNEGSGVENVMVRNHLLKGIHYEDIWAGGNQPRIHRAFIRGAQVFAPVAQYPASYPTPANVRGIEISAKVGVATQRTTPGLFNNFILDDITVSSAAGQNDASPVRIGAAFYINGVAGVSITNSHAEYADIDIVLGDNYAVRNIRVENFDGYVMDPITIQIGNNSATNTIVLENIYNNYYSYQGITSVTTISDLRSNSLATITDVFVLRYSEGKNYLIGNAATSSSHVISRARSGTYAAPAGTALTVESTGGSNTGVLVIAGGASSSSHAILKMAKEGGTTVDALAYYNGELFIDNGYAARKVSVPATASTACSQGQWAADVNYHYDCVSTNTWRRAGISTW